ncbi:NAD-dependent protein deacylase Sirt4 isoform X1 [Neodiprion fabricii]|uniref:NAD-dependent protein deacylase Sirt4 isoform X1 n=2 Tax=Neodiprion fabricii TaxID=2872261 RepID=UPI001ED8FFD2|nr:NAD-dependent protein deacylase Sirt4 isoform X1 [Neodiprion fabricii]
MSLKWRKLFQIHNIQQSLNFINLTDRISCSTLAFVPKCQPVGEKELSELESFMTNSNKICVLTGAGISTESGIPDYRSEGVGLYARSDRRPVLYKEFCESKQTRRRYWARNYVGWPRFSSFVPNSTHKILKNLEDAGKVSCVITQNVDNLHFKAGSKNVIELHGTAFRVTCLNCDHKISRYDLQKILQQNNKDMKAEAQMMRPDGDVELSQDQVENFVVPSCGKCGGILKPDIVFFGDNVPRQRVDKVKQEVEMADSLLVLGSSLSVFSGLRIILQAVEAKRPIAIVNIGKTRADQYAQIKVAARCGEILPKICSL